ncbi:hypothetical protein [Yinghuangia seranimata]|uniref:hypothetical protein n=1 Tax=Yinghuangia seranimata TaxID=408067 RepID=UPI00248AB3FD|nr:hypothetical protein [Yinghuangia seranimata]MDI2124698.1 hypothetical protein [Yinghuangia seranimata]
MRIMRTRKSVAGMAGLVVAGALVMTGCNGDKKDDKADKSGASSAPAAASPGAASSSAGSTPSATGAPAGSSAPGGDASGSSGAGGTAKGGQVFKIGEAATIDFRSGSTTGTVAMTVTSIDMGASADLDALKLTGDSAKGKVPYYVKYTLTNTGTTDLSYTSAGMMHGLMADGRMAQPLIVMGGNFPKCPNPSAPKGFTKGQSYQTCVVALVPEGMKVAGAEWSGEPYSGGPGKGVDWGVAAR